MKPHQKTILKILLALFLITGGFLFATMIFAQDFGVNIVGEEIALPTEDPRIVAARIIRVALGFLGIVAVAIVLYGGFVWMTAAGNEERISKAKKILTSGLIGLIIIVMAFSITQFVLNSLMEATGITPGVGGPGVGGPGGPGLPSDSFIVRGIQPNGDIPIRNVVVRVVFNKNVDATSLAGNFTVKKTADGSLVLGTASASGTVVEFVPNANCPEPNEDRKCFDGDTEFTVEVTTGLRSTDGRNLICGGLAPNCQANFTTGNLVDVTGPEVEITYPDPGQSVSADNLVSIEARATDDAGISYLEYFTDGGTLGTDAPAGPTPRDYSSLFDWDTTGVTAGSRHTLTTKAFDIDTNDTTSGGVDVIVRAAHCFNGSRDADETGIDCGGADCGTCDGGSCSSGADCRSGTCIGGVCRTLPTITSVSPNDGAPGNYVTIFGRGFGASAGQVYFSSNQLAPFPSGCAASVYWRNNQIIVQVPAAAVDGPIRVVVPPPTGATVADYTDQTDDERGQVLPNFDINDVNRPGICSVTPDRGEPRISVSVAGAQFGGTQGTSEILFGGTRAERVTSWNNTNIGAIVPLIAPATVPVQVVVGGQNSNPVNFLVVTTVEAPRILRFEPSHGPVGEYVTIFGANFGNETGQVFFKDALGADILAATDFPAACGTDWWKNDQIIVKVPTGAETDILKITTAGAAGGQSDDTSDLDPQDFTVDTGTAGPGICKITPDNGPADLPVILDGERFGSSAQVNFYRAGSVAVTPTGDTQISTTVSVGAQTGPVTVTSGTKTSNSVNFTVQDCRTGVACPSGQQCCRDGSCALSPPAGPGCVAPAGKGYYFWQFSTGEIPIYPQVVESCSNPPPPLPPSPSPWADRSGGDRVCINAEIGGRFTTKINPASINSSNILVERCADQSCTTRTAVAGTITFQDVSDHEDGFTFRPSSNLTRNTWYQITLNSGTAAAPGIRSCLGGAGCPDGGYLLDGDRDGVEGGDYIWQFKTRDSDETCAIGLVGVAPYERTLTSLLATQDYTGLCFAAEDVCTMVNCSAYRWSWSSSDVSKATVAGSITFREVATARAETEAGRPVRITGGIPSERKSGSGNLTIDFTDPRVVTKWPDCQDACSNAEIGAEFNTNMNRASVESIANVHLYIWKCGNGVIEPGEDCDDGNANPTDGCSEICRNEGSSARYGSTCHNSRQETGEDCDGEPFPARCGPATCLNQGNPGLNCGNGIIEEGEDCDGSPFPAGCNSTTCLNEGTRPLEAVSLVSLSYDTTTKELIITPTPRSRDPLVYFLPNTFYRVTFSNNITSTSGVRLTDLNYPTASPNSYSWAFKTKNDANPCAVDRVAIDPKEAILNFIGATQNYASTPFSSPDVCSPNGQRLFALDYPWDWTSADAGVATITNNNNYPKCGNGVVEFGEDCDGVPFPAGCSAICLNTGSTGTAVCGNGRIELGEDCDDGNTRSGDGCNSTCRHEGSVAGGSICGNRAVERGEDCDDGNTVSGDGCSATCLNQGTVTDTRADPYQTATGVDLKPEDVAAGATSSTTEITAEETGSTESDNGDITLRCGGQDCRAISPLCTSGRCAGSGRICTNDTDCELGLGRNTCCYFKPKVEDCDPSDAPDVCLSGATDVCRNARLSVTFDQVMDEASVTGNILVVADYAGSCPEGTTLLSLWTGEEKSIWRFAEAIKKWLPEPIAKILLKPLYKIENDLAFLGQIKNLINQLGEVLFGRPVIAAPVNPWCVWPGTASSVIVGSSDTLRTEVSFSPTKAFDSGHEYRVLVLGDNPGTPAIEGIKNSKGVALGGGILHNEYPAAYRAREIYQWSFTAGPDICTLDQITVAPDSYTFSSNGETREFFAVARDARGRIISPLPGVYDWRWQDWLSNDSTVVQLNPTGACSNAPARTCDRASLCTSPGVCQFLPRQTVTAQNKNGDARILVSARMTADTILPSSTVGRIRSGGADVTVFLCENPQPGSFYISGDTTYNFKTNYCRDRGDVGTTDDLPGLKVPVINPPAPTAPGDTLLREYFLFVDGKYCTLSKMPCELDSDCAADGGSCQPSPDAVGIRIYTNKNHFSLADWYLAQGFRLAAPSGKTVDGYEALQDGRTIYISAANQPRPPLPAAADLFTNVYLISYNDGAHPDTIEIYNQLVNNLKFNINLHNDKICRRGEEIARGEDGAQISCSADFDCPQTPTQYLCASPKDKLARDVKRLVDLEKIKAAVETYRLAKTYPPKLEAGSFVRGISTSKWDSWAVLGQELKTSLPTDPLNKFQGCVDPYSADTCWSVSTESYVCPGLSHIYQYRYEQSTGFYVIGSDLEYMIGSETNPSYHWFRFAVPARIQYEDVCNNTVYSVGGICGDGIINDSEECEASLINTCSLDPTIACRDDSVCGAGECRVSEQICTASGGAAGRQSRTCNLATCRWNDWGTCLATCGNGIVDSGETCDRGPGGGRIPGGGTSSTSQYQCNSNTSGASSCRMSGGYCGDGTTQTAYGERCDDGTWNGGYGKRCANALGNLCMTDAACPYIFGTTGPQGPCRPSCATGCVGSAPYCGNTVTDSPREECDRNSETARGVCYFGTRPNDGNPMSGLLTCENDSGCPSGMHCAVCANEGVYPKFRTSNCLPSGDSNECRWGQWLACTVAGSCGNGVVEGGEQCDDSNTNNNDGCVNCQNSRCGDGQIRTGIEPCDSGAANGTPCSAPYGTTCNYCSRECTLRTVSGPVCGDGTINGPEQCDSCVPGTSGCSPGSARWICVNTSNPWETLSQALLHPPACSPSSCAISCATGRACNNIISSSNPDADTDGIGNACDPNDNSDVDGCLDDARDCATVSLRVHSGNTTSDSFDIYIDNHLVGRAGGVDVVVNTLSRGLHNMRIVYGGTTGSGRYTISSGPAVDWGLDSAEFEGGISLMTVVGDAGARRRDFTVR